jgi:hypothetical protein
MMNSLLEYSRLTMAMSDFDQTRLAKITRLLGFASVMTVVLFILLPVSFIIFSLLDKTTSPHRPDSEMLAHFYQHEHEFEQLAQALLTEEEIRVVYPDSGSCQPVQPETISEQAMERCEAYVALFQKLGFGWAYSGPEPLFLTISTSGLSVSGSSKGYLYTSNPQGTIVEDTDQWDGRTQMQLRPIKQNWYIFFLRS